MEVQLLPGAHKLMEADKKSPAEIILEEARFSFRRNFDSDQEGWKIRQERAREGEVFAETLILDKNREEAISDLKLTYPGLNIRLDENPVNDDGKPLKGFEGNEVVGVYVSLPSSE